MRQSVIRDPGGEELIRIRSDICGEHRAVVNGSLLLVPPGTVAFVAVNGQLSPAYPPGRYELFTGVDPFFVRFKHLLTGGDPGVSVSVFYVSPERSRFLRLGTGEFFFHEPRFGLTLRAMASCSLSISIADPARILRKLVGSYRQSFSEEDIGPCIEQIILSPVREVISQEISELDLAQLDSSLGHISRRAEEPIRQELQRYGIGLEQFSVLGIHLPDEQLQQLSSLEQMDARGRTMTDLELDNLHRVWGGSLQDRMLSEALTGISSRGTVPVEGTNSSLPGTAAGSGSLTSLLQLSLALQLLPGLQSQLAGVSAAPHTDLPQRETSPSSGEPDGAVERPRICPRCGARAPHGSRFCPRCGQSLGEEQ